MNTDNLNGQKAETGPPDELDWLAFRYLACELSEAENRAFEARLADETAAQEALVRAVELSHALSAVLEPARIPAPGTAPETTWQKRRSDRTWRRVITAVVAALLVVGGVFFAGRSFFSPANRNELKRGQLSGVQSLHLRERNSRLVEGKEKQPHVITGRTLPDRGVADETVEGIVNLWSQLYAAIQPEENTGSGGTVLSDEGPKGFLPNHLSEEEIEGEWDNRVEDGEFDWVVTALHTAPSKGQPSLMDRIRKEPR